MDNTWLCAIRARLSHTKKKPRKSITTYYIKLFVQYIYWFLTSQLHERIKQKRLAKLIGKSGLFDAPFYSEQNPQIVRAGIDPLFHFVTSGACEGHNPNPLFDTSYYLKMNPGVAKAGINPLARYLLYGSREGRDPNPLFDTSYYLENNPGVAKAGINPLAHYLVYGFREGRDPSPLFDTSYYLENNLDVAQSGMNPLVHYLVYGFREGRIPSPPKDIQSTVDRIRSLEARYSSYSTRIPVSPHNSESLAVTLQGLMSQPRFVVALSHDDYRTVVGGIQLCIGDEQLICNDNQVDYLHFFPTNARPTLAKPEESFYVSINCNGQLVAECQADLALEAVKHLVRGAPKKILSSIIIHQLLGYNIKWVRRLVEEIGGGKALFWVHDYFALCPNYNLLRNDIVYCHAPPVVSNSCQICIYGEERVRHLQALGNLFDHLDLAIITPSHYAEQLWKEKSNFSVSTTTVKPHCCIEWENAKSTPKGDLPKSQLNIGFLGRAVYHKGWEIYEQIVRRFGSDPRYQFFHFSDEEKRSLSLNFIPVSVSSENRQAMSDALKTHHIDVAFLWSVWPETFCFTGHEAMAAGCYVVTHPNSGNIQHIVLEADCGTVLANEKEAVEWFESDRLIEATREFQNKKARFGSLVLTPGSYNVIFENLEKRRP